VEPGLRSSRDFLSPELTKRVVGIFVVLLSVRLLLMPVPLSNILPAKVDSKDNSCRKETNREQNSVFLKIPERDHRDQNEAGLGYASQRKAN
jgi:hypothetical protein